MIDPSKIMKALLEVKFDGMAILDHSPALVGGRNPQVACGVAYMRALLARANGEARIRPYSPLRAEPSPA